ncbi:MAG: hypothetical protein A2W93_15000 [Bacteroidetes bacterium GWF2_43_63]|nr:MAG: hypothetical protein A2W94_01570 [Bacteroidetes bacterium GWE2_42_42]OFY52644.1 MAG: hypothetical protein A2W93_15000 [Bacteroidetes bacterium GWF2_43_63]HBG69918.1 hypothetical protein [Bacteroidales bacterium]HCB62656.1 hypothetical protein [Bacteroidales bacterium]HCY23776.1 hypothetical protein [Bacteroidales bacterium]
MQRRTLVKTNGAGWSVCIGASCFFQHFSQNQAKKFSKSDNFTAKMDGFRTISDDFGRFSGDFG